MFFCKKCKKKYETCEGIPILIDLKSLPEHLKEQINYFERETNERIEYSLAPWQKAYLNKFISNTGKPKGKLILDCGTGSGYMAIELAKLGAKVIACDLTLRSLISLKKTSQELGLNNVYLVCCTAESLPFKSNAFDCFISNAVLEHLPREREAIYEINRVTKNKANLMMTVPLNYRYLNPLLIPINWLHDKRIGHLRRYDEKKLAEKFKNWTLTLTYYTGHTTKAIKLLVNIIAKTFDEAKIEEEDELKQKRKQWANNIICFFKKKD